MSPAKLMVFQTRDKNIKTTKPVFPEKTAELLKLCRGFSIQDIAEKMNVNAAIARDVQGYFRNFDLKSTPLRAAARAYNGIAYKGLSAHDFNKTDIDFAQKHLNILSGFYGILRPFDEIKPYRLEFARKIQPEGYGSLYDFWQDHINRYLAERLEKDEKTIINVASKEYSKAIINRLLPQKTRIIEIKFLQQENGEFKQIVVHSKKARGLMARFIVKNRLTIAEEVKAFDYENYFYYPQLSTNHKWVFVR